MHCRQRWEMMFAERKSRRLIAMSRGIYWHAVDRDDSIEGLLAGRASGESQTLFRKCLTARASRPAARQ